MKRVTLLTKNGLELGAALLFRENDKGVVYCQHRLVSIMFDDNDEDDYAYECDIICDWCIMPEAEEFLYETAD